MTRAIQLAASGLGIVEPNPLVGCVIVHENRIIGEGYHHHYGGPHAEVLAISSVREPELLKQSTLYVNLEPCSHHGKTPPCSDLILNRGIPRVVIACKDPFEQVNGRGIERLRQGGVEVQTGICEREAEFLNRRFFTSHRIKRPYVILKWAQSSDGMMDRKRLAGERGVFWISGNESRQRVHQWRTEETAVLFGVGTVLTDNPYGTARTFEGRQPLRIMLDRQGRIPVSAHVFHPDAPSLLVTERKRLTIPEHVLQYHPDYSQPILPQLLAELYKRSVLSILVEGGAFTLRQFIDNNLWDEMRIFTSPIELGLGLAAPVPAAEPTITEWLGADKLETYFRIT